MNTTAKMVNRTICRLHQSNTFFSIVRTSFLRAVWPMKSWGVAAAGYRTIGRMIHIWPVNATKKPRHFNMLTVFNESMTVKPAKKAGLPKKAAPLFYCGRFRDDG
jgi:hypothetical protein